jgi:hypothetical protein
MLYTQRSRFGYPVIHMKFINSVSKTLAFALLLPALSVTASDLESAIKAALDDTPGARVDLFKSSADLFGPAFELFQHRFGVETTQIIEKQKRQYVRVGKLTHIAGPGRKNDVISYRITRDKGAIKEITWQINGGEWLPLSEPMMTALGNYRKGEPMTGKQQQEAKDALKKAVDKTWQKAAEFLITQIAIGDC